MATKRILLAGGVLVLGLLVGLLGWRHWKAGGGLGDRDAMLALMPEDASAVVYVDLAQLRSSPLFAGLLRRAPQVAPDSEYAQFLQATGFNYETDLDRLALAIQRQTQGSLVFAVAQGRFDRKRIESYASKYGSLKTGDGKRLFAVPMSGSNRKAYFTFLREDRVAWANDSSFFFQQPRSNVTAEWREHFLRVAGTPLFAVLRQDSGAASALSAAPGGLQSPQLAALLAQLQWISISAKPDGNLLHISVEGECTNENTQRQLKEVLGGLVVLAQMGLNDPKTRKQLAPGLREGYSELLQSADIQQLDRGTSKSVRVVFEVTPKLLEAAPAASTGTAPAGRGQ
ncbi:MAG TPA: hypothetical protein VMU53_04495 [Candidatus Sulfotelmatobacter sp.]|nr:hypothetical protein [Candidatus Sulfotelmatobacter sp.]